MSNHSHSISTTNSQYSGLDEALNGVIDSTRWNIEPWAGAAVFLNSSKVTEAVKSGHLYRRDIVQKARKNN